MQAFGFALSHFLLETRKQSQCNVCKGNSKKVFQQVLILSITAVRKARLLPQLVCSKGFLFTV